MFGEVAWEILLNLYVEEVRRAALPVTSISGLSRAPATTALRWLNYLESERLIRLENHPHDRRSRVALLTDKGRAALDAYYSETINGR
jgi:DNA-binding MarR family transcriptional regulator